ncbi:hypothetical protein B0H14DRAFT_3440840 [Mycena olivaceomarginata]|nr:hypothetical protein B0H14DRAFT_3440840 [Mycena olivaceomarginata]
MSTSKLFRADANHAPLPHVAEYYQQRASTPGSLLITEATFIAARAGGHKHAPGIWSDEQIAAWKKITDAVHAKGSYIYLQLWALGRAAEVAVLEEEGLPNAYVSASNVPIAGQPAPRPLTVDEIQEYVQLYATAASNAVHKAGFDGVEIHAANGYLLDQFLHDRSNIRTDAYGGSATATQSFAYLHVVEPRVDGSETLDVIKDGYSNDFIRDIWGNRRLISAGGYTRETAVAAAEEKGDLIAFARPYIANPDLPYRLLHDIALAIGNRALYYAPGSLDPKGYTDYPFAAPVQA